MNRRRNNNTVFPSLQRRQLPAVLFLPVCGIGEGHVLPGTDYSPVAANFYFPFELFWILGAGALATAVSLFFYFIERKGIFLYGYRKAMNRAPDDSGLVRWVWDRRRKIIFYCRDIREPFRRIGEERFTACIAAEERKKLVALFNDFSAENGRICGEFRVLETEGGKRKIGWKRIEGVPGKRDARGKIVYFSGLCLDITDFKEKETELKRLRREAEESNRLKSAFLANMGHEIRSPLSAITGFSRILADKYPDPENQEYIAIIENNNDLLTQLIGDILDLAKIEAGTIELIYSDFDLKELMQELESTLRVRIASGELELYAEPSLPVCRVHSERNRLSQLLQNLLTNAVKFTRRGVIRFGYERKENILRFYVKDTGCGIPPEKQEEIFGRFVKLNAGVQGTGLGLAICRTLAERMGGRIGVESQVGKGSEFWFEIPYLPAGGTDGAGGK